MKILYFTSSFPYGLGEQWKTNELNVIAKHFDITVVPNNYDGNFDRPKTLPTNVKLAKPLFENNNVSIAKTQLFNIIFSKHGITFLKEFFSKKVYSSKQKFTSWFTSSFFISRLLKHPFLTDAIKNGDQDTILLFFWGKGTSEILPFIDTTKFRKILVRMHRYDLFEYVNNDYIPYRGMLLNKENVIIAPSSDAGKQHLQELYPNAISTIQTFRLGTIDNGKKSFPSTDGVLRIVSCSHLSPVKRVRTMIESLKHITFKVEWHHLGDGALKGELEQLVKELDLTNVFLFEGMIDSSKVLDYYASNRIDIFVNISSSEGVPFSIMEAMSAGIPVMATDVGGTSEIVDDSVGCLFKADVSPTDIAKEIHKYYYSDEKVKADKRKNAYNKYVTMCNARTLTNELVHILMN